MAILSEAEVQEIREQRYATISRIESKVRQSPFDQCVKRDCQEVVSVAETCLAALAEAERLSKALAGCDCQNPRRRDVGMDAQGTPGKVMARCGKCRPCLERAKREAEQE